MEGDSGFSTHRVSDFHFNGSTGYGYNDRGREVLDLVYADVMGAEAALVTAAFRLWHAYNQLRLVRRATAGR